MLLICLFKPTEQFPGKSTNEWLTSSYLCILIWDGEKYLIMKTLNDEKIEHMNCVH